jgi:5-methylcytosine-specific restriction endonuclease McrA
MSRKKEVRAAFRDAVFSRDHHVCKVCGCGSGLDAHHIIDRNEMPCGGYVPANGISLCAECHLKAEAWHATGRPVPGYSPEELYALIGSTFDMAIEESEKLRNGDEA